MSLPILVCGEASSTFRVKTKKFSHSIFNNSRPENKNFAFLTVLTYRIFTIWLQLFWFIVSVLHLGLFWQFLRRQWLQELVCELWNVKGERGDFMKTKCRMRVVRPSWEGGGVWNQGRGECRGKCQVWKQVSLLLQSRPAFYEPLLLLFWSNNVHSPFIYGGWT